MRLRSVAGWLPWMMAGCMGGGAPAPMPEDGGAAPPSDPCAAPPVAAAAPLTWTLEHREGPHLFGLWARPGRILAVGGLDVDPGYGPYRAHVLSCGGSGEWSDLDLGADTLLQALWVDGPDVWVGGQPTVSARGGPAAPTAPPLFHSGDFGASFAPVADQTDAIVSLSGAADLLFAVRYHPGGPPYLWRSADRGVGWSPLADVGRGDTSFVGVHAVDARHLFAAGGYFQVGRSADPRVSVDFWTSSDGGDSWTVTTEDNLGGGPRQYVRGVWGVGRHVYAFGAADGGGFLRHACGGSWQAIAVPGDTLSIWGPSAANLWIAVLAYSGGPSALYHSTDAGAHWAEEPTGATATLMRVAGTAADDLYAVGLDGVILHGHR